MIRAIQLVFAPAKAWTKIVQAKRGVLVTVLVSLLPLMLVSALAEGYALAHWGARQGSFDHHVIFSPEATIRFEMIQLGIGLAMVFGGAFLIQWMSDSFHLRPRFAQCFDLAAYGLSPIFLARLLHTIPALNIWILWAIGAFGCIYVLYQGIGIVLEPEQTKGFGLYLLTALVFTLLSGIAQLTVLAVLQGRFRM